MNQRRNERTVLHIRTLKEIPFRVKSPVQHLTPLFSPSDEPCPCSYNNQNKIAPLDFVLSVFQLLKNNSLWSRRQDLKRAWKRCACSSKRKLGTWVKRHLNFSRTKRRATRARWFHTSFKVDFYGSLSKSKETRQVLPALLLRRKNWACFYMEALCFTAVYCSSRISTNFSPRQELIVGCKEFSWIFV